jgi:hypothetical protein
MSEETILVLKPDTDWDQVNRQLKQYGCSLLNTYQHDNERFAAWDLPESGGELDYHVELTIGLGYFVLRNVDNQQQTDLAGNIEHISADSLEQLFTDNDPRKRRQGIRIAALLNNDRYIESVRQMCHDADAQVAYEAKKFCDETLGQAIETTDDAVALFTTTLNSRDRRQILRWLLHDFEQSNAAIEAVVTTALSDLDWEVRVTAIIAAARYRLIALAKAIETCVLEPGPGQTIKKRDKEIVHGIRQMALFLLLGKAINRPDSDNPKHLRWWRLYCAVAGEKWSDLDYIQVAVDYFTQPLPASSDQPTDIDGLACVNQQAFLANTDIEMCWVPAIPHVLGNEFSQENPLRVVEPANGFFISRFPLLNAEDLPVELPIDAVSETVDRLIAETGVVVAIPQREQWEMAMRGTDGRNYPWGWGVESDWMLCVSPWGLSHYWTESGELCQDNNGLVTVGKMGWQLSDGEKINQTSAEKTVIRIIFDPSVTAKQALKN